MVDNGRGTLADRSRDDSTSTMEGCLGCFHLRSVGGDNSSIGVVDSSRGRGASYGFRSRGMDENYWSHWSQRGKGTIGFEESSLGRLSIQTKSRDKSITGVVKDRPSRGGGHTGQENLRMGGLLGSTLFVN